MISTLLMASKFVRCIPFRRLNLSDNYIGAQGAASLGEALRVNTSITSLNLSCNYIGAAGAASLGEALHVNTSITSLGLSYNRIGDEGAASLGEALRVNTSITFLNLDCNEIGDEGETALLEALRVNTSITSLYARDNTESHGRRHPLREINHIASSALAMYNCMSLACPRGSVSESGDSNGVVGGDDAAVVRVNESVHSSSHPRTADGSDVTQVSPVTYMVMLSSLSAPQQITVEF